MSRSGYVDDWDDQWALIRWRGAVASAIRGKRGQAFLREMLAAIDQVANGRLIKEELENPATGAVCAIGAVGKVRGIDMKDLDPEDPDTVAEVFGIPPTLAREIVYENDEGNWKSESPEERYKRMREWIERLIRKTEGEKDG